MTEESNVTKNKDLSIRKIILILAIVVIVCAAVLIGILFTRQPPEETSGIGIVNESNLADIGAEMDEKVAKGMFETHMNMTWTFPDGNSPSTDAVMGNSPNNNYPFWFDVKLADTGEELYKSGTIPVGQQVSNLTLSKTLTAGQYAAIVTVHMVEEDGTPVDSNMGFNINIIIQN